ncbi:MAG: DUF928 domain-containing protein [Limnospira sp.]
MLFNPIWKPAFARVGAVSLLTLFLALPGAEWVRADDDIPGRRAGGGTRSGNPSCTFNQTPLMAVVPKTATGLTAQGSPTLYFYLPPMETNQVGEFVLLDSTDDTVVYEETLQIGGESGIIGVTIPSNRTDFELKTDRDYQWYFSIVCDPEDRSGDVVVEGRIRRTDLEPTLVTQLNQGTPLEQVNLYLKAELWYDALSILAQLQPDRGDDPAVSAAWNQLLQSVDLGVLAREPVLRP